MFSTGICIIIILLNSYYLELIFKTEILVFDPLFLSAFPFIPLKPKNRNRSYMSKEDKIRVSNKIPDWFKEVVCGLILSDASIRINGRQALMSIQQTHQELTQEI